MTASFQRYVERTYLAQEAEESTEVKPGSGFDVEKAIQRCMRLSSERHEVFIKALRREIERRGLQLPSYYQPYQNAVILRDGAPWHGRFWCGGNYFSDEQAWSRAWRVELERCQRDALRENAWRDRHARELAHAAALAEDLERSDLNASLQASVRYSLTRRGKTEVTP